MFVLPVLNLAQTPPPGPLTNQQVILMVQSGVRNSEVARVIGFAPTVTFNLTPADMDQLLRSGVSDEMIRLMSARQLGLDPMDNIRVASLNLGWLRTSGPLRNGVFNPEGYAIVVPESTPVRLRLTRNLSSAHTRTADVVSFEVLEDVTIKNKIGTFIVIERGAIALGTITETDPKRRLGRSGMIEVTIDSVRLADGDKIALRAVAEADRHGHVGAMVGVMVPTAFVVLPATPFWLFMHGKESTIKDGFDMTAYTDGMANLDSLDFQRR